MKQYINTVIVSVLIFCAFAFFESMSLIRDDVFLLTQPVMFIVVSMLIYSIFGLLCTSLIYGVLQLFFKFFKINKPLWLSILSLSVTFTCFSTLYLMMLLPYLDPWDGWTAPLTLFRLGLFFISLAVVIFLILLLFNRLFKTKAFTVFIIAGLVGCFSIFVHKQGLFCPDTPESKKPHVILITIDALRADHLSCYFYKRNTSPCIDAMVKDGSKIFTNAYTAAPYTMASLPSIITSSYPFQHGCMEVGSVLPDSAVTVSEILEEQGYKTVFVSDQSSLFKRWHFDQGFSVKLNALVFEASPLRKIIGERLSWFSAGLTSRNCLPRTLSLLHYLNRYRSEKPLFIWYHMYWDTHTPYLPPPPFRNEFTNKDYKGTIDGEIETLFRVMRSEIPCEETDLQHLIDLYDGNILFADYQVSCMIKKLREKRIFDNSLFILSSDHGESLGEKGFFSHVVNLYEPNLKVPLILKYPGTHSFSASQDIVRTIDIAPTITDQLGLPHIDLFFGKSLNNPGDRVAFSMTPQFNSQGPAGWTGKETQIAMRKGTYKFIHNVHMGLSELYDLSMDSDEVTNLIEKDSALRQEWLDKMEGVLKKYTGNEDFSMNVLISNSN
ncbi:sulfatase [bacterium]|nr:sulfatase [bacterium]